MSEESLKNLSSCNFAPDWIAAYKKDELKLSGNCLKHCSVCFHHKIVNFYVSYTLDMWSKDFNTNFTFGNWLFLAAKLTKNANPDKHGYKNLHKKKICAKFAL